MLSKEVFQKYATEIAELANIVFETTGITHELVIVTMGIFQGQLISVAAVLNKKDGLPDIAKDVTGTPEKALKELIADLKILTKGFVPEKHSKVLN